MSSKSLINLGIAPDSGTGDSARKGGEKINILFSDIYANFGDNPVGNDPSGDNYGYRVSYDEYEYKVGELHPAGRYQTVYFSTPSSTLAYDATKGYGVNSGGSFVTTGLDGIPNIYKDSEWYFLSRGECITADLSQVTSGNVHFVLPLAVAGDTIIIRDTLDTWGGKVLNIWTTPYEFQNSTQVTEWAAATGGSYSDTNTTALAVDGTQVPYKAVTSHDNGADVTFADNSGQSNVIFATGNVELTFIYRGPTIGWVTKTNALDTTDFVSDVFADSDSLTSLLDTSTFRKVLSETLFNDSDNLSLLVKQPVFIKVLKDALGL